MKWQYQPLGAVADLCLGKMLDQKKNRGEPMDEVSDDPTPAFPPGMIHPTNIRKWHREGRLPLFREWKHSPTTPPGTGEPATATPRGDPSKVCGEKFSRTTS